MIRKVDSMTSLLHKPAPSGPCEEFTEMRGPKANTIFGPGCTGL
jgi:hypothetical protein